MTTSAWTSQDRCFFCRRRAFDFGNGLKLLCKRHKNKPLTMKYYRLPFVITDEGPVQIGREWECNCGHQDNEHEMGPQYKGRCVVSGCRCLFWRHTS